MKIFIAIIIINTIIALIVLGMYIAKKNYSRGIAQSVFMLLTPVVGPLCVLFAQCYNWLFYKKVAINLNMEELSMSTERVKELVDINVQVESDFLPLRESISTVKNKDRREVLLEILKREKDSETLGVIRDSVQDEDREVSHYAISYVTYATAEFRKKEELTARTLEEYQTVESRIKYVECLSEILKSKMFPEYEEEVYIGNLDKQIIILMEENPEVITGIMISTILDIWERMDNQEKVSEYVGYARELCSSDLVAAKTCLKKYFKLGDKEEFIKVLTEIKNSPLDIDSEVLEWIRFYNIL